MISDLIEQIKTRKLGQWGLAYLAGAWVLLQVVALISDSFAWPRVISQLLLVVIAFGFLATLILAWYHGEQGRQRVSGIELLILTALLVTAGTALAIVVRPAPTSEPATDEPAPLAAASESDLDRSIAVLPFENLSDSKENEYFSDGVTEDILTALAKIETLRVISRTSAMQYKDSKQNLRTIASELGVGRIVEGSVTRVGDRVRIVAQLIDARTDRHLWGETYDRELKDIFQIRSEIAEKIASALATELSPETKASIAAGTTSNLTAYDYVLRGREYMNRRPVTAREIDTQLTSAESLFKQALQLDPTYAVALAELASVYAGRSLSARTELYDSALVMAKRAIELDPKLSEAYWSLGNIYSFHARLSEAEAQYLRALELNPGHAKVLNGLASIEGRRGRHDRAIAWAKRSIALDPTNARYYEQLYVSYGALRDFGAATQWARKILEIAPDHAPAHLNLAGIAYRAGDTAVVKKELQWRVQHAPESPDTWRAMAAVAADRGNWDEAVRHLERALSLSFQPQPGRLTSTAFSGRAFVILDLAYAYVAAGRHEAAAPFLREMETIAQHQLARGAEHSQPYVLLLTASALRNNRDRAIEWARQGQQYGLLVTNAPAGMSVSMRVIDRLKGDSRYVRLAAENQAKLDSMRALARVEDGRRIDNAAR